MSKMVKIEPTRHQVAVAGQVTDKETGRVVSGAQVSISTAPAAFNNWLAIKKLQYGDRWDSMNERPDRTQTASDGYYYFMDLPNGQYQLTASLPGTGSRYGTAQVDITVARDSKGNITMVPAPMAMPPTTIKGKVSRKVSDTEVKPVVMADIRMKGSGEHAFSNDKGEYRITGLEKGNRTVQVSAKGLKIASQATSLNQGAVKTLDFVLLP
jgi:hypothetical protein